MNFWRFTVYTVLGCLPWVLALTWIGALLGERWDRAEAIIRPFAWAIAIALALAVAWFVWHRVRQIRREEAARLEGTRDRSTAAVVEGSDED
jgi:membrane protein DedA with SNARE-associated domain